MRRIILLIFSILLLNFSGTGFVKAVEGTKDASCTNVDQSGYKEVGFEAPDEQTFVPNYDRFTGVDIIVGGHTWGVDGITFTLFNAVGTIVGTGTVAPTINGGPVTRSWTPANPISVRKGVTYRLRVENPNSADFVWYATGDNNCYPSGNARQKNVNQNFDFGFTTYGYDAATATPAPTATPGNESTIAPSQTEAAINSDTTTESSSSSLSNVTLNAGSSAGSGDAPSTSTTSSIATPTDLKLIQEVVDSKPILSLSWVASTTTTDGYKIFRSETENSGFKNIAKTESKILEFKDGEIEVGKTYYYQIRAYKGSSESKSSNTVSKLVEAVALPIVDAPPEFIPIAAEIPLEPENFNLTWWLILIILILALIAAVLYKFKKWPFNKLSPKKPIV